MNETDPAPPLVAPRARRWPIALLVALITGIASAALAIPVSDWAMEALHVSNFEGGRAMGVVCIWAPLAMIIGCLVGFAIPFFIGRRGFAGYAICQSLALVIMALLISAVGGLAYAAADHPPLLGGKNLALEIEVQVPTKGRTVADLQNDDFQVALVVSASDRSYSDLRWIDAVQSNESIFVTAWAKLNSSDAGREITVGVKDENRQVFNVMRTAAPRKIDEEWSEWAPPRERFDHSKPAPNDQYLVRYRVRFADEYSPTPTPAWTPEPGAEGSPNPEESADPSPNETP